MRVAVFVSLALAATVAAAATPAKPPVPDDFAYGMALPAGGESAFYQVSLPLPAYQGITQADQGDLLVFNGQGEIVPFALRRPAAKAAPPAKVALPLFPVLGAPKQVLAGLSLTVRRDSSGAIVSVNTNDQGNRERKVVAHLIDTSSLERGLKAIELAWEESDHQFVARVSVQASDDLEYWNTLVKGAVVADLRYGDYGLERREIALPFTKAKYLRLSPDDTREAVPLTGVRGVLADEVAEPPRQWVSVSATTKKDEPHDYYFDSQGHMPVDRVRVRLPQKNTLIKAALSSRDSEKSDWRPRGEALVYDLRVEGTDLVNPDVVVERTSDRYWKLSVEPVGGGLGQGGPRLALGWSPQQLLFVARGGGPFLLAYGSARVDAGVYRADRLLSRFDEQHRERPLVRTVQPGPQHVLGGEAKLRPPPAPLPWKRWLLWSALVLGVVLLAWMALHLYRQLGGGTPDGRA